MTDRFITVPDSLELPAAVKVPVARLVGPAGAAATPADIGAATAAQGAAADTAVQPDALGNAAGLDVGTTAGTVKAGDWQPTAADVTDSTAAGRALLTGADAAAQRTSLGLGTASSASGTSTATTAGAQAYAYNAPAALALPTYDGSGAVVHPSVIHIPGGFGPQSFEWWMGMTPYTNSDNAAENPSILASSDGITWQVPAGLTNPLKLKGPSVGDFNSDPCLVHHDGLLYCFYRSVEVAHAPQKDRLYVRTSRDGFTWSAEALVLASDPAVSAVVSPAIAFRDGVWHMWAVDSTGTNTIRRWTSSTTPTADQWAAPTACTLSGLRAGMEPWHIDVKRDGGEWFMIAYATAGGTSSVGGVLHRATSTDGLTWKADRAPLLSGAVGGWDAYAYKSSAVPATVNGRLGYRLWYGALSGAAWRVGHTFVTLRSLEEPDGALPFAMYPIAPYVAGDRADRADGPIGTSTSGHVWEVAAGSVSVSGRQLVGASNGCAYIDAGTADVEVGATIKAVPAALYTCVVACGSGVTDGVRFGANGPTSYSMSVRVGNVNSFTKNIAKPPAIGDRLKIRVVGGRATGYVNDLAVFAADASALAAYTRVGVWFTPDNTGALGDWYCKAI